MKTSTMFNFDLLFGDHMAKCSDQAKLYYIKLCFFANCGFVANPLSVLDSLGYDKGVYQELIDNGEILKLPDRCEVFITAYFVHNHFKASSWLSTPYAPYWKGKLYTKKNGIATFTPQSNEPEEKEETIHDQIIETIKNEPIIALDEEKEEEIEVLEETRDYDSLTDEEWKDELPY